MNRITTRLPYLIYLVIERSVYTLHIKYWYCVNGNIFKRHKIGELGLRNAIAIYGASVWGLTASELSRVTISDVLDQNGQIIKRWLLPEQRAFNTVARIIYTINETHMQLLSDYIDWLIEKGLHLTNSGEYRGLNPGARLLVNDQIKKFGFTGREANSDKTNEQSSGLNSFFKRLIERSELKGQVTYTDFRKSMIIQLKRAGIKNKEIMVATGIKDYNSIRKIVATDVIHLEDAIQGIYDRI